MRNPRFSRHRNENTEEPSDGNRETRMRTRRHHDDEQIKDKSDRIEAESSTRATRHSLRRSHDTRVNGHDESSKRSARTAQHHCRDEVPEEQDILRPRNRRIVDDDSPGVTTRRSSRRMAIEQREQSGEENENGDEEDDDAKSLDMYSRVKRVRRKVKRDMYGFIINEDLEEKSTEEDTENEEQQGEEDEEETEESEEEDNQRQYNLRQNKPVTQRFEATIERRQRHSRVAEENPYFTPPKKSDKHRRSLSYHPAEIKFKSPAHRRRNKKRKRACHNRESSSSTSSSESDDEKRFSRRKNKSMVKARQRCLPMNLRPEDVTGAMADRQKIGASLADIDPMSIDRSVTFESVGGLTNHIRSLKEMVVFPLLYPEVFDKFKIAPPRGVLFYGPPGTGKTLVARALANECSYGDKRVAFFMRKGADCLSKWVGESERQLRLLFDQAYQMRPSIIFFDEIDGLAPVRSSRQDQIHSSIVSTLLALMDGLDSRGEVVVIGATNRIDSIDPALRRPGRFDRELLFTLPNVTSRADILAIHTKHWNPPLRDEFLYELAEHCAGYCGADLKSLCTEGALHALRRRYPQIYQSSDKLQLDISTIHVSAMDFHRALQTISPASQRSTLVVARPLTVAISPLLLAQLNDLRVKLEAIFPHNKPTSGGDSTTMNEMVCGGTPSLSITKVTKSAPQPLTQKFLNFSTAAYHVPIVSRPRMLIQGLEGQGHTTHLAPALLHSLEYLPTHVLDLSSMYSHSSVTPEEACNQVMREVRRSTPSILYLPRITTWWHSISDTVRQNLTILLSDIHMYGSVLLLATAALEETAQQLPQEIAAIFSESDIHEVRNPEEMEIRDYFTDLLLNQTTVPPQTQELDLTELVELPRAATPPRAAELTTEEEKILWEGEESVLRELRLFLRDILNKLASDRKFNLFTKPVDPEEVPDYYEIILDPMDLSNMMSKIDLHQYHTCKQFLEDIELICHNALEYNPPNSSAGRAIRHRACALKDTAFAMIDAELDQEFEKQCAAIIESRKRRNTTPSKSAPKYYHTRPVNSRAGRYSRRLRGQHAEEELIVLRSERSTKPEEVSQSADLSRSEKKRRKRKKSSWSSGVIRKLKKPKASPSRDDAECSDRSDDEEVEINTADSIEQMANGELDRTKEETQAEPELNNEEQESTLQQTETSSSKSTTPEKISEHGEAMNDDSENIEKLSTEQANECGETGEQEHTTPEKDKNTRSPEETVENMECSESPNIKPVLNGVVEIVVQDPEKDPVHWEEPAVSEPESTSSPQPAEMIQPISPPVLRSAGRKEPIVERVVREVVVNKNALEILLGLVVEWCLSDPLVSNLEKVYCEFAKQIYKHRADFDKTLLVKDLYTVYEELRS